MVYLYNEICFAIVSKGKVNIHLINYVIKLNFEWNERNFND